SRALVRYRDEDVKDGLALLDNWGLVHALFQFSPCLVKNDRCWKVAEGHTLAELAPAPKYAPLWKRQPRALVDLLIQARCRPVRSWAIQIIRADLPTVLPVFALEERLGLLAHDDEEVVALIADLLREDPALKNVPLARWLYLVGSASAASLDLLCELMRRNVDP